MVFFLSAVEMRECLVLQGESRGCNVCTPLLGVIRLAWVNIRLPLYAIRCTLQYFVFLDRNARLKAPYSDLYGGGGGIRMHACCPLYIFMFTIVVKLCGGRTAS